MSVDFVTLYQGIAVGFATRIRGITCSASARYRKVDWFDAQPKLHHSLKR